MITTEPGICSRALIMLGGQPIVGFDDGTEESMLAEALFSPTLEDMLSRHPWKFATAEETLARLAKPPADTYRYAYQLPIPMLRVLSATDGGGGRIDYRIRETRLETDSQLVMLSHIFRPHVAAFPPYFTSALLARLAAEFALPLTESSQRAQTMMGKAEEAFRSARLADSQQQPPQVVQDRTLLNARR